MVLPLRKECSDLSQCAGTSHANRSCFSLKSACGADKVRGVRLPGDQSGHIVYTHADANMADPGNSGSRGTIVLSLST